MYFEVISECFNFFTFDAYEGNFIMAGFRVTDGLKTLIVKSFQLWQPYDINLYFWCSCFHL